MKLNIEFKPKLVECLKEYNFQKFCSDLVAGATVGIVAIPLSMAFGIASGVKPEAGLFTAIIAGFIISALGGSRVQIGGPTGAFIVIVYGIIANYGLGNLMICTIMAGIILMIMGFSKMGTIIKYIPYPVTVGFTNGIAILIFSTQIKDFLGLQVAKMPTEFIEKMKTLIEALPSTHLPTALVALVSLLIIFLWPKRWGRYVPGSIIAIVLGTIIVTLFKLPLETIGSRFGGIPQGLPPFHIPNHISWQDIHHLMMPAITIALLAAIESLLSAVVADDMIDDQHDSNQELIAQGVANFVCPFLGGIPATGAIARTATNIKNGAVSPIAGIVHAIVLLIIVLIAAPLAKFIPLATLSAVLVAVCYHMGEWHAFARLKKYPRGDAAVLLTTFGLTVIFDLTVAVEIGMLLACVLFIHRISEASQVSLVDEKSETEGNHFSLVGKNVPANVAVFRALGALMFGIDDKLENILALSSPEPKVIILRMRKVMAMDSTALKTLENLHKKLIRDGKQLILCGVRPQPYTLLKNSGFIDHLGNDFVAENLDLALEKARAYAQ
jgi:SulP family sulfate permease